MNNFSKIFLVVFAGLTNQIHAQEIYVNKEWEVSTGSVNSHEFASGALDNNGNHIVIGNEKTNQFSSISASSINSGGNIIWEQLAPNTAQFDDYGADIAIDNFNNLYICGAKHNGSNYDYYIAKYSGSGTLIWQRTYNGTGNGDDIPSALTLDNSGNVYVTGGSFGQNSFFDFATLKLDNSGTIIWTKRYDFSNKYDAGTDIAINNSGEILVCGGSNTNLSNSDFVVIKYNPVNGNQMNLNRHNTPGNGYDMPAELIVNPGNTIFVTGLSETPGNKNIKTISYSPDLQQVNWVKYIDRNGLEDEAGGMAIDHEGNILLTGFSRMANSGTELFVEKREGPTGNLIWEKRRAAPEGTGTAKGKKVRVDQNNNIVVAGEITEDGITKILLSLYTPGGRILFQKTFAKESSVSNKLTQLRVKNKEIYVTGISETALGKEIITVKYSFKAKPAEIVYENGVPSYNKRELLVKFDPAHINRSAIDNKKKEAGALKEFVAEPVLAELKKQTGHDWSDFEVFKIFRRMTTADSISETRLGELIRIEEFWSVLSVFLPAWYKQDEAISDLNALPGIIHYAEKNYIGTPADAPNDGLYSIYQDGLMNIPSYGIFAEDAWDTQVGQTHTKVGIFDYGIDWMHQDFGYGTPSGTKVIGGWDFDANISPFEQNPFDINVNPHGTMCAGIIGALRNNNEGISNYNGGIAGIAGGDVQAGNTGCQLFSMGIGTLNEVTDLMWHSVAAAAIVEGAVWSPNFGYGLHIQNHSWATPTSSATLLNAVKTCFRNGCLLVAASGNDFSNGVFYPACYSDPFVLKVGASNGDGVRPDFSTYGNELDVIAPGTADIYKSTYPFDTYNSEDGTSAAAPHAAGVAALLHSEHYTGNGYPNNLAPEDYEYILQVSVTDIPPVGYDADTGHGRINAKKALDMVSLPLHHVEHLGGVLTNSTQSVTEDLVILVSENINGVAAGYYYVDRYVINNTFIDVLDPSKTILAVWPRYSSSISSGYTASINDYTYYSYNYDIDQNQISFQTMSVTWKIKYAPGSVQLINKWIPGPPDDLKNYYSVLVENNIEVGLNTPDNKAAFKIYPNPAADKIKLELEPGQQEQGTIELIDLSGRSVFKARLDETNAENAIFEVDIASLESGVYVCKLILGDKEYQHKIVKK